MSLSLFYLNAAIIFSLCGLLWLLSLLIKNVSIIDIFWGFGFVVITTVSFFQQTNPSPRAHIVSTLVTIWGLRLAIYLFWRNWGKAEDFRYQAMRQRMGPRFAGLSFFTVFSLQGLLILWISLPIQVSVSSSEELGWLDGLGLFLVVTGVLFESIGDFQLARFKKNPQNQGKVLDRGLWKFTRHPNYFGDFVVWWGFYCFALEAGGVWTLVCPLLMSYLLLKISGVALLEKSLKTRKPGYADYIQRTSSFFPRFPNRKG